MNLRQPSLSGYTALGRRSSGAGGPSREDLIQKLNDARCKWMVTLHRYDNSSGKAHQSDARNNGLNRSRTSGHHNLVPAADFCPECGSIVEVELECNREGEFVAEHRRGCSGCEREQQTLLTLSSKGETPNPSRISSTKQRRYFCSLDKDWRRWQDQLAFNRQGRNHFTTTRGSGFVPRKSFVGEEIPVEKSTSPRGANSISDVRFNASAEDRPSRRPDCQSLETATGEKMFQGSVRPTTTDSRHSDPRSSPTDKRDHAGRSEHGIGDQASGDPASGDPASGDPASGDSGSGPVEVPTNDCALPADGEWAEEIRKKDELISTLKRQLTALGEQPIEEVVTLEEAKKRLREAIDALMAGDASAEMEHSLEKWDKYVTNHPDHIKELAAEEQAWEDENEPKNNEALHLMKSFVPPNIFHAGLDGLRGGGLPPALAKRIFDRKVLWLIRAPKGMVSKTHVVELKSKFLANDLDIVESRALHACLPSTFENDTDGAKTGWRSGFRKRLKELLDKETKGQLKPAEVRRPVYKDLAEGPFDPDAAAEEQEPTRSSAFDAQEKPVVGGKLKASTIAVIGEGLATKLQPEQLPRGGGADGKDSDGLGLDTRSAPNSPASKYRRQSYALSRAAPTASSMKNMMSELGNRLSHRRLNQRRSSSFDASHDISKLLQGTLDPVLPFADPVAEQGELPPGAEDASSEGSTSEAASDVVVDPALSGLTSMPVVAAPAPTDAKPDIVARESSRSGEKAAPPSMKDMMAELASKAKAREERAASPASQIPTESTHVGPSEAMLPPPAPKLDITKNPRSSEKAAAPSMKDMMAELASKAKAREERAASPISQMPTESTDVGPSEPLVPTSVPKPDIVAKKNSRPSEKAAPPSMKDMMAELASKAKAREERAASPTSQMSTGKTDLAPPEPLVPPPVPKSGVVAKKNSRSEKATPPSMKDMMAELASKAKAREERAASPASQMPAEKTDLASPEPLVPPPVPKSGVVAKKNSRPSEKAAPPSMKDMMAELASKAKAREERAASPSL